jgi:O-antigen ligase
VVWTLFAFAGAYTWTLIPAAAAVAAAAFQTRPRIATPHRRVLDIALLCCLAWGLLQLIPIPAPWRDLLSPHAAGIDAAMRFGAAAAPRMAALSIAPAATLKAVFVALLTMLTFWSARDTLGRGVLREIVRPIAWIGFALSIVAIGFRMQRTQLIYGVYATGSRGTPYGPFSNQNHLGTWLVLALPIAAGYAVARAQRHGTGRALAASLDTPMVWLLGSTGMMVMAAIMSLSRSTAVGLFAASVFGAAAALRRTPRAAGWVALGAAALVALAVSMPATARLAERFAKPEFTETWSRPQIWRETLPIVRDFALTGTGMGGYGMAMLVYQKTDRAFFFNQAHDQYLQLATDGGIILLVPLAVAALAFGATVVRRLRHDVSPMYWIRVGAAAAIVGVLVQSVWETGLRMPANALLFAIVCAIAVADQRR